MSLPWHKVSLQAILSEREHLPHALLLRGREGTGKLEYARALAQALLCEHPSRDGQACGTCAACGWFIQESHPDFRMLEPAAEEGEDEGEVRPRRTGVHITVAQVRALHDFIFLTSHRGGRRIVLIHPAERLNVSAANALLKNLEEPPARTHFLLVAHRWHQLLPTIRSRCRQLALPLPEGAAALHWLKGQSIARPELALAQAGGAPLLASRLDEDYWRDRERLLAVLFAPDLDPIAGAETLHSLAPARIVGFLQKWSFDIALRKLAGRVHYNHDRLQELTALAAALPASAVVRFHRRMLEMQRVVHHPLNTRLLLEDLLLDYAGLLRGESRPVA
jgi:DNA polymerase-3 subunit delta'